jgi:type IV pilus assembly protein PilV
MGFTLIEVLVAVVMLAIGLLGVASLQVMGQRTNDSAYLRSQAALQAYDMTDRMRANLMGVRAGGYADISGPGSDPECIDTGCTPLELAQYDAFEWNATNQTVLPSGQGTVVFDAGTSTFAIDVSWDDDRDGTATTFSLEFRP